MMKVLKALASLRLTVVLFALAMFLILAGTLAQVNDGVWTVVDQYFRSLWVRIPLSIFLPQSMGRVPGAILFPGGFLIAGLLLVNLLAAHAIRFKMSWNRSGIIVMHAGVILLLVGEFVTGLKAVEGNMTIDEGASSNFVEDIRTCELAIIDPSSTADDLVVVVPQRFLEKPGETITNGILPFSIRVDRWMPNSQIQGPMQAKKETLALADSGAGTSLAAIPVAQATGVDGNNVDVPSAYITLFARDQRLGSYLVSVYLNQSQPVSVNGKTYLLDMRFERTYKPYTLHLVDFKHDKFVGTETPRNFSSRVRLVDPSRHVDREALIAMNEPLRHAGDTLYQSAFKPGDTATILQVVRNPGWLLPYISCVLVGVGMIVHFLLRFSKFARRQAS